MKKASFVNPTLYKLIFKNEPFQQSLITYGKKKKPSKLTLNLVKNVGQPFTVFCRNTVLLPYSLGLTFIIYNGVVYLKILVSENIIGHKLGEFSQTRKRYFYKNRKNKKKKRR